MSLSKSQQNFILKNRKLKPEKIAAKINVDVEDVKNFLKENPEKQVPKFFYLILVLIPIVFVVLLEISLRVFNYGDDYSQWIPVTKDVMGLNPDIGAKYFSKTKALPESIQDTFDKVKKDNSFRVFVLGGSSAAGYPFMPLGSFSRYIDQRLKHVYPNRKIEVVNISLTAVNSFTVRDFIPGVLEQKPDLILIYAGHNEFYGALGIGSMESLGTSRDMVNLILYLDKYRTTQLVRDFLSWVIGVFSGDEKPQTGTLMARMAEDQSIPLASEVYEGGIDQFRGNIRDVIKMVKDANVNLVIGNLVSNYKGQSPFISSTVNNLPSADEIYIEAENSYINENYSKADSLYRYAKDLDLLRFRAPEDFNSVIYELSSEYNIPIVNVDSAFSVNSPNYIVGDNLMTDHLHPTVRGYQIMGNAFYSVMSSNNFLPKEKPVIEDPQKQDSITVANFHFSELDSISAYYKIKVLKNDWPYLKDPSEKVSTSKLLNPQTGIDSIAYKFVVEDKAWIDIQQEAADYYLKKDSIKKYLNQMRILIYQYPFIPQFYEKAVKDLVTKSYYDLALELAQEKYKKTPDAFSTKWIGIISLSKSNIDDAEKYLKESLIFNPGDEQVLYNLAGVFVQKQDYNKALNYVNQALEINNNYSAAQNLKAQLENALKK